jgi:hypothetical protein
LGEGIAHESYKSMYNEMTTNVHRYHNRDGDEYNFLFEIVAVLVEVVVRLFFIFNRSDSIAWTYEILKDRRMNY